MSKEFWEICGSEPQGFEEDGEPHWSGNMHASMARHLEDGMSTASISQICHDTGKVRSHSSDDLRAQLDQLRLVQGLSPSRASSGCQRSQAFANWWVVEVDDELHGQEGEWLVVDEISPDKRVLTLQCFQSGALLKRAASAVHDDIRKHRLKIYRCGDPDIPPELE